MRIFSTFCVIIAMLLFAHPALAKKPKPKPKPKNTAPTITWNVPQEINQGEWIQSAPLVRDKDGNLKSVLIEWDNREDGFEADTTFWQSKRGAKVMPQDEDTINPPCYNAVDNFTIRIVAKDTKGKKTIKTFKFHTVADPNWPSEDEIDENIELDPEDESIDEDTTELF